MFIDKYDSINNGCNDKLAIFTATITQKVITNKTTKR